MLRNARVTIAGTSDGQVVSACSDAVADKRFAEGLLIISAGIDACGNNGVVLANTTPRSIGCDFARIAMESALSSRSRKTTSIDFGEQLIYKLLRWVEDSTNPEVEIGRALADKTK